MSNQFEENKKPLPRISMRSIWNDFVSMLNFEKGAMHTCKGLLLNPRKTIDEYLHRDRSKHAHPMRFLLFSTALSTIITYNLTLRTMNAEDLSQEENGLFFQFGKKIGEAQSSNKENNTVRIDSVKNVAIDTTIRAVSENLLRNEAISKDSLSTDSLSIPLPASTRDSLVLLLDELKYASAKNFVGFVKRNKKLLQRDKQLKKQVEQMMKPKVLTEFVEKIINFNDKLVFILVPLYAFGTFLFFRKKSKYNYAENLVANAYLISFQNVILIATLPLLLVFEYSIISVISALFAFGFTFYFWMDVFDLKGFKGLMKSLMVLLLSYFVYLVLIALILRYYLVKDLYEALVS